MSDENIPLSDPGPLSGKLLKDHQRRALSMILYMEHNFAALEEARRRQNPLITNYDLLDLSAFSHIYKQTSPSIWENVITHDEIVTQSRPVQGSGMIVADEMGVGKSAPIIALAEVTAPYARAWALGEGDLEEAEKPVYILPPGRRTEDYYIDEPPPELPAHKKRRLVPAHGNHFDPDFPTAGPPNDPMIPNRHGQTNGQLAVVPRDAATNRNVNGFQRTAATLIVCPKSVLAIWKQNFDQHWEGEVIEGFRRKGKRTSSETLMMFDHWASKKGNTAKQYTNVDVILTTYEALVSEWKRGDKLYDMIFYRVVFDEGHRFCNMDTQVFRAVEALHRRHVLILTGTPIQNRLSDLCSYAVLLRLPGGLDDEVFVRECLSPVIDVDVESGEEPHWENLQTFAKIFTLRRLKSGLIDENLPPKKIKPFWLEPTAHQKRLHDEAIDLDHPWATIARQRRIASNLDAKDWFEDFLIRREAWQNDENAYDKNRVSSKVDWLRHYAEHQCMGKIVIFSQWTRCLNLIERLMLQLGYTVERLQGNVEAAERPEIAERFNNDPSEKVCLLATIGSVGEGISLVGAQTCAFTDLCWNPSKHAQAMDRLHRIGQRKEVTVYMPMTKDTIEEDVWVCQQAKRALYHHIWPNDPPGALDTVMPLDALFDFLGRIPTSHHESEDDE